MVSWSELENTPKCQACNVSQMKQSLETEYKIQVAF